MSKIYHAPSAQSIIDRLAKMGIKARAGSYGAEAHFDGVTVSVESEKSIYGANRPHRLEAKYRDTDNRSKRTSIRFKLSNGTPNPETNAFARDYTAFDGEMPDELWQKFEPKLRQAIEDSKHAEKVREASYQHRINAENLYKKRSAWIEENAPEFRLRQHSIEIPCYDFEAMQDRLKAAHEILFPKSNDPA